MKIMVINNNAMFENEKGLFIYHNTGDFLIGLTKAGATVENFHFRMKMKNNSFMATFNVLGEDLKITAISRDRFKYLSYLKAYLVGIIRLLKNDFTYLFYPNSFLFLTLFAIIFRKPYGIYLRGEKGINSMVSKFVFRNASVVLTVSPSFTEKMIALKCQSETIRPMINYTVFDVVKDRKYNNKEVYNLLFLARIEFQKGIFDLLYAISLLIKENISNFMLNIVGDGPDILSVQNKIKELKLESYVQFHGKVIDKKLIKKIYIESDVFVFPTHPNHEGFPRVLYEAMIFGTPIITTTVGAISYLMKDKYNCYEIEHQNPIDLSKKIISLINDYSLKANVALNAILTVRNYLSNKTELHHDQLMRIIKEGI